MEKVQVCRLNNKKSYIEAYQIRKDCGYGYKVVCCYEDKYSKPIQMYRGKNTVYKFVDRMLHKVEYCKGVLKKKFNKPLVMSEHDKLRFKLMDKCHIRVVKYTEKDVHVKRSLPHYWKIQRLSSPRM